MRPDATLRHQRVLGLQNMWSVIAWEAVQARHGCWGRPCGSTRDAAFSPAYIARKPCGMNDLEQRLARLSPEQREQLQQASMRELTSRARMRPLPCFDPVPPISGPRLHLVWNHFGPLPVSSASAWDMRKPGAENPANFRYSRHGRPVMRAGDVGSVTRALPAPSLCGAAAIVRFGRRSSIARAVDGGRTAFAHATDQLPSNCDRCHAFNVMNRKVFDLHNRLRSSRAINGAASRQQIVDIAQQELGGGRYVRAQREVRKSWPAGTQSQSGWWPGS